MDYHLPYRNENNELKFVDTNVKPGQPAFAITPFLYRKVNDKKYVLKADLIVWDGYNIRLLRRGFGCNGLSAPGPLHWYVDRDDYLIPVFFHDSDYLFHGGLVWRGSWVWVEVTKEYADCRLMHVIDDIYNTRKTKTDLIWFGVHAFGWYSWYFNTCDWNCNKCSWRRKNGCPYTDFARTRPRFLENSNDIRNQHAVSRTQPLRLRTKSFRLYPRC